MKLFDVYPLYQVEISKGLDTRVWDDKGQEYLDLYGGHAVISIGHTHPHYVSAISEQVSTIGFYSNSILNKLQVELAEKLGRLSSMEDYSLFLCNSGAEANENALKLASFATGRKGVLCFNKSFHGRTSAAVSISDNAKIIAPINENHLRTFVELEDIDSVKKILASKEYCAVIIEGIQGIGGMRTPSAEFMKALEAECRATGTKLVLDEVQSGCGRTGKFFAFQHLGVNPDIVSIAKGIANGFPMGGILISPEFEARYGMLGTTFGGSHLACAAAIATLDVIKDEDLMANAAKVGAYAMEKLSTLPHVAAVKGRGLMFGVEFNINIAEIRKALVFEEHIFTGGASNPNMIRILPALTVKKEDIDSLYDALLRLLNK